MPEASRYEYDMHPNLAHQRDPSNRNASIGIRVRAMALSFPQLGPKQQRGSKPRCHLLTHGPSGEVARRLTALIQPWGEVHSTDRWMPRGFEQCAEAQLHSAAALLPDRRHRDILKNWWLAAAENNSTTPNIDLASTCDVLGNTGMLLIEAKAHDYELKKEEAGKNLAEDCSDDSKRNHEQIGLAIEAANASLSKETGHRWALSRDSRYQMSNRFAWAWKLTELGMPVILAYLGFVGCEEMREGVRQRPMRDHDDWRELVLRHSAPLFSDGIWNRQWRVNGQLFIPLILTSDQLLKLGA